MIIITKEQVEAAIASQVVSKVETNKKARNGKAKNSEVKKSTNQMIRKYQR